ncbi:MAG: hypothetical protein R3D00_28140 [Bacteroidia bacterium]
MKYQHPHANIFFIAVLLCGVAGCFFSGKSSIADTYDELRDETAFLVKDSAINDYFAMTEKGIFLYENAENKKSGIPEAVIYPEEYELFAALVNTLSADSMLGLYLKKGTNRWPDSLLSAYQTTEETIFHYGQDSLQPLKGLRIALDPGHVAGDFETAVTEGKYIHMKPSPATYMQPIQFFEAGLTLATAWVIREELEAMGATVLMTRTQPGRGALGLTFQEWKNYRWDSLMQAEKETGTLTAEEIRQWKTKAQDKDIMSRFFTPEDLRERAKLVNAFHPHLTLIIHYNVDSPNWENRDAEGNFSPTGQNYCMAFVPGAFMAGELAEPENRLAFLRMVLTNDVKQSIELSRAFIHHSTQITGVPIVTQEYPLRYLHNASVYTGYPGVYARNLSLTRLINGPVCYGESLCQDNISESRTFNTKDTDIGGVTVSKRVKVVARAYVEAVKEYTEKEFAINSASGRQ